ncbi:MAG: AAA family ATPase [Lachnospiraceae bacterium]|nr:AAA family ATPase [Lachnospiraceae bacterium]
MMNDYTKIRELKKVLRSNGQGNLNGKPVSYLLSRWRDTYEYVDGITVKFVPLNPKYPANVAMYINLDAELLGMFEEEIQRYPVFFEDYLLRYYSVLFEELSEKYTANNKLERLLSKIQCQKPDCRLLRRSGLLYNKETNTFVLKLFVLFPTGAGVSILGERISRMITDILKTVEEGSAFIDKTELQERLFVYKKQIALRKFCMEKGYVAFVADGSMLPRKGDCEEPLAAAVPFMSPERLWVTVPMEDGTVLSGMGIPKGITVITGAGFSGKTTLLEAIEAGIYNHIPGDGREFVVAEQSLAVTNAEDGRYVANEDISIFFSEIPFQDIRNFTTKHASGSISQAANIIEAIGGGSRLLTIDEDKSATNFMIRDELMRRIVKNEVIIPFTDRIRRIAEQKGISTILVIGGAGEYLKIADTVILMHEYVATDVTEEVKALGVTVCEEEKPNDTEISVSERRVLLTGEGTKSLLLQTVCTEDSKKVICGEYSVDMTAISSLKTNEQLHSLAWVLRNLLSKEEESAECLNVVGEEYAGRLFAELVEEQATSNPVYRGWWFDEIRKEDILMCVNRTRGICFGGGSAVSKK